MKTPVIRGFHSATLSDMLTHRQINVERFKTALHGEYDVVSRAVFDALVLSLAENRVVRFDHTNQRTLRRIVTDTLRAFDLVTANYVTNITRLLMNYTVEEASFFETSIRRVVDPSELRANEEEEAPPFVFPWGGAAGMLIAATGFTAADSMKNALGDVRRRLISTVQRARANNLTTADLLTSLQGSPAALHKDGLFPRMKASVAAIVDTIVQAGMSAARNSVLSKFMDLIVGYTWVSILDSRTTPICRSLSGRQFEIDGGPLPPAHIRCRSHVEPLFKSSVKLRPGAGAVFNAGETFYRWLSRQGTAMQDEVLGPTRAKLFRGGGLTADQFAVMVLTRGYRPLTLDELRKKNPEIFARANV